jgi:hypothetical protein
MLPNLIRHSSDCFVYIISADNTNALFHIIYATPVFVLVLNPNLSPYRNRYRVILMRIATRSVSGILS